jgi:hypothetical protein
MPRRRLFRTTDSWEFGHDSPAHEHPLAQPKKRRAATTVAFAALFFAGAAFTAVAGDRYAQMTQNEDAAATDTIATTTGDAATEAAATTTSPSDPAATTTPDPAAEPVPAAPAPAQDPAAAAPDASATAADPASADPAAQASAPQDASADAAAADAFGPDNGVATPQRATSVAADGPAAAPASAAPRAHARRHAPRARALTRDKTWRLALPRAPRPAPAPEIEGPPASATIWLNSVLPDPTPPVLRLSPAFARRLLATAKAQGVDWALLLGILRAQGATGHVPAPARLLRKLSLRLVQLRRGTSSEWATALAYEGRAEFADRALALARYDRAVGLKALVHGLESAKRAIAQRILSDPSISIYGGGRDDIARGKVDVRVLALISYLHQAFGEVTVSCLITGHRLYARPGVVSAHIYGHAVDIAALGETPILGHQEPGGLTEQAVRDILLLPAELMPKQVISLLGLGGPSFPLADHYNHIHIGY